MALNAMENITRTQSKVKRASTPPSGADGQGGCPGGNNKRGLIGAMAPGGTSSPAPSIPPGSSYVQHSDLQGITSLNLAITTTVIVDGQKLGMLLRPKHKYYAGKGASIASMDCYEDASTGKRLLYARVKALHRDNPYRKLQLRRQTTGRTTRDMFRLIETNKLADFRVNDLTLTVPSEVSRYLAGQLKRGRGAAWRMEERFWKDLGAVGLLSPGMARSVNLHVWKTEEPVKPHFHFHELIPNYGLVPADAEDEDGNEAVHFIKHAWDTGAGGKGGAWTEDELKTVKAVWTMVVKRFARKHGIKVAVFEDAAVTCDVATGYLRLGTQLGRVRFQHKLNYKARHWSEDFARYSRDVPDCPDPPAWLQHYDNRTRVFGWWSNLKTLTVAVKEDKEKLSPYTGKTLEYIGNYTGDEGFDLLLEKAQGRLSWVEFVRGRPVEGEYPLVNLAWLRSVCMVRDGYGNTWRHPTPEGESSMDLQGITDVNRIAPEDVLDAPKVGGLVVVTLREGER